MGRPQTLHQSLPGLWQIVWRLWPRLRTQRGLLAGSSLAVFAEVGLRLLEPWPLKFVFDRIFAAATTGGLLGIPAIDSLDSGTLLVLAALAVVIISGLRALAAYWNSVGFALAGNRVLTEMRGDLYSHLQRLSLSFHTKAKSGDLVVRVIGDIGRLQEVAVTAALPLAINTMILVGMAALMFWLHWELALIGLSILPLFWLSTWRIGRRIREVSREQRKREGAMASTAAEAIGAIKVVQALSLEKAFARVFTAHNQKGLKEGVRAKRLSAGLERTVDVLVAMGTALVLWYGARLVLGGELTPGDLLVFLAYLKNAFKPVRDSAKYTGRLAKAAAAGERVLDVLDRIPEVRDLPGAQPAPPFRGVVKFENVDFGYEPEQLALGGVSFEARPGQRVALVGPSGSGKSTLVGLVMRLYDPTAGRVLVDGRDIRDYTIKSLRAQISVVLQDTILFAGTIRENIAYGASDATSAEIRAAARLSNAHSFVEAMPHKYATVVGERGVTLSNGQRQRIAIARAAVRQTPILILDEPTVGLDEENERLVTESLERLAEGRTTFFITHNLQQAASADLILYIENGH
ncbi:MAG: ABC transporter ATP-binding protein, partial [Pyrinomonadaceae bacterium]